MAGAANELADTTSPRLLSWPQFDHPIDADLVYTFDEPIKLGTGTVTIETRAGVIYTGPLQGNPHLTVSGNSIMFNPPGTFSYATDHWVEFSGGGITDLAGNKISWQPLTRYFLSSASMVPIETNGTPSADFIRGSDAADSLSGGEGSDQLYGHRGDDILRGEGWADELYGDGGNDKLYGGDHPDWLDGGSGDDLLDGGSGDDMLEDGEGHNTLLGGEGKDSLVAGAGSTGTLDGGAGDDGLRAYSGANLAGGIGDDSIELFLSGAGATVSVVDAGDGNDQIDLTLIDPALAQLIVTGGAGTDSYLLRETAGQTAAGSIRITDFTPGAGGDRINLNAMAIWEQAGNPFSNGVLRLVASGADTLLQMRLPGTGSSYRTLLEFTKLAPAQLTSDNIFGGLDPAGTNAGLVLNGTDNADVLWGQSLDDQIAGKGGDDELSGAAGDDLLDGGDGADGLYGGIGSDRLLGGAGNDQLDDSMYLGGDNHLEGGTGNDELLSRGYGNNLLDGGTGEDRLEAGNGSDTLLGGDGDDGLYVRSDDNAAAHTLVLDGGAGNDGLMLNVGSALVDIIARGGAGKDSFSLGALPGTLRIADFSAADGDVLYLQSLIWRQTPGNPFGAAGYLKAIQVGSDTHIHLDRDGAAGTAHAPSLAFVLEGVQLASLTGASIAGGWRPDGSETGITITGTAGDNNLRGQDLDDTIRGGGGSDRLFGGEGNDLIEGGDDAVGDRLEGEAGNDTLRGGAGYDLLIGGAGNDVLEGRDGGDHLLGDEGDDVLRGGAGDDTLIDYSGNDTFDGGDGDDRITAGIASYGYTAKPGRGFIHGGAGDDWIDATLAIDLIDGGSGDDRIHIAAAATALPAQPLRIDGGEGKDLILLHAQGSQRPVEASGGAGSDSFIFMDAAPAEASSISDFEAGAGGDVLGVLWTLPQDSLANPFGASGYARLLQRGSDTVLQHDADGAQGAGGWRDIVALKNVAVASLDSNNFDQGTNPDGSLNGYVLTGSGAVDHLTGGRFDDTLDGGEGDDSLIGGAGADLLRGAGGADLLYGGMGDDRLYGGDGNDSLHDIDGNNLLDGGDGDDTLTSHSLEGGVLRGGAGDDKLVSGGNNIVLEGGAGNDRFVISESWEKKGPLGITIHGGEGDDLIMLGAGQPGTVVGDGGEGRDTWAFHSNRLDAIAVTIRDFQAGEGGDLLDLMTFVPDGNTGDPNPFSNGSLRLEQRGADTVLQARVLTDGATSYQDLAILAGIPKSSVGAANVVLGFNPDGSQRGRDIAGTPGNDTLDGGWLDDTIAGGAGNDILSGSVGDDRLSGGDGDDILSGDTVIWFGRPWTNETGNDLLEGGAGKDTLHSAWGNDTLRGGDGDDVLWLDFNHPRMARADRIAMHGDAGQDLFWIADQYESRMALTLEGGTGRDIYAVNWLPVLGSITITDFQAGADGDQFALNEFSWPLGFRTDPFTPGFLRFAQRGADTVLEYDGDGAGSRLGFQTVLTLKGVTASSLTAANIVEGYTPAVAVAAPPPPPPPPPSPPPVTPAPPQDSSGTSGGDQLTGGAGNDRLDGGKGNDLLFGGAGNDALIGGAGFDNARYAGERSNYTVTRSADGFQVMDKRGASGDGSDTLSGVERVSFADGALALDIEGVAGQAYRIYRAAFDREPDLGGLGYWLAALDRGASLEAVAGGFMGSDEFLDLYGSAPTNADVVMRLYKNVLHRDPDPGGFAFWVKVLDEKRADLPHVLAQISDSPENVDAVAELIANGIWFTPYGG